MDNDYDNVALVCLLLESVARLIGVAIMDIFLAVKYSLYLIEIQAATHSFSNLFQLRYVVIITSTSVHFYFNAST